MGFGPLLTTIVTRPAFGIVPAFGSFVPAFGSFVPAFGSFVPAFGSFVPAFGWGLWEMTLPAAAVAERTILTAPTPQ